MEQDLKAALEDVSPGASIRQSSVEKLQGGSYEALTVTPAGQNVGVKAHRAEVAELQKIRKCVDIALKAEQPEQTQNRTKRHDIDR